MKFLAWDIGIKNLAYNIIDYQPETHPNDPYQITYWGLINLVESDPLSPDIVTSITCQGTNKTKSGECVRKATYLKKDNPYHGYCGVHAKKENKNQLLPVKATPMCGHLLKKGNKTCAKKGTWLKKDNPHIGCCNLHYKNLSQQDNYYQNPKQSAKVKQFNIKELSIILFQRLQDHPEFLEVDHVIIENQPAFKNPMMKSIQMMLYSHFVIFGMMKDKISHVSFFMAGKKLDAFTGNKEIAHQKFGHLKSSYSQTKKSGVLFCQEMVQQQSNWHQLFSSHKKKDDLADAYLTNCCYIKDYFQKQTKSSKKLKENKKT